MYFGADLSSELFSVGKALGRATGVGTITVRSNLNADSPLVVDPLHEPEPGPPNPIADALMSILKPEVTVVLPTGPYVYAPKGKPSANYGPLVAAGLGGVLFSILGMGGLIGRFAKPATLAIVAGAGLAALSYVASGAEGESGGEASA